MSPVVISIIGLAAFFLLMSQGMPIAFAFALVGSLGVILIKGLGPGLSLIGGAPYTYGSQGSLLAVPLFVLMGFFVYTSGISKEE